SLVILDRHGTRWDALKGLASETAAAGLGLQLQLQLPSAQSAIQSQPHSPPRPPDKHIVLERWRIELLSDPRFRTTAQSEQDLAALLPGVYKRLVAVFDTLQEQLPISPTHRYSRRVGRRGGGGSGGGGGGANLSSSTSGPRLRWRVLDSEDAAALSQHNLTAPLYRTRPRRATHAFAAQHPRSHDDRGDVGDGDDDADADADAAEPATTSFVFAPTQCPAGTLAMSVTYRTNCDFRVDDSEVLLSSRFMGQSGSRDDVDVDVEDVDALFQPILPPLAIPFPAAPLSAEAAVGSTLAAAPVPAAAPIGTFQSARPPTRSQTQAHTQTQPIPASARPDAGIARSPHAYASGSSSSRLGGGGGVAGMPASPATSTASTSTSTLSRQASLTRRVLEDAAAAAAGGGSSGSGFGTPASTPRRPSLTFPVFKTPTLASSPRRSGQWAGLAGVTPDQARGTGASAATGMALPTSRPSSRGAFYTTPSEAAKAREIPGHVKRSSTINVPVPSSASRPHTAMSAGYGGRRAGSSASLDTGFASTTTASPGGGAGATAPTHALPGSSVPSMGMGLAGIASGTSPSTSAGSSRAKYSSSFSHRRSRLSLGAGGEMTLGGGASGLGSLDNDFLSRRTSLASVKQGASPLTSNSGRYALATTPLTGTGTGAGARGAGSSGSSKHSPSFIPQQAMPQETAASLGSLHADEENISDFLRLLDGASATGGLTFRGDRYHAHLPAAE
ncbi:autophagy protein 13, partial [Ascosphaera acerosa]